MSDALEASERSRPRTETALRVSVLLALAVLTGCGGGGAPGEAPTTRPPVAAAAATLFPGDETGQANDPKIDFPRVNPGESAAVDVTVVNSTDKPMKVKTAQLVGEEEFDTAAPTIPEKGCEGQTLAPGEACRFRLLIPPGAADTDFKLEIKTDQGNVTAAVSARASGEGTPTPDPDTGTDEPGAPTMSLPPDTGGTSIPPDGGGTTEPGPDEDTIPEPAPDTAPEDVQPIPS